MPHLFAENSHDIISSNANELNVICQRDVSRLYAHVDCLNIIGIDYFRSYALALVMWHTWGDVNLRNPEPIYTWKWKFRK